MGWNPKKTIKEVAKDPVRAVTAASTGGLSEQARAAAPALTATPNVTGVKNFASDPVGTLKDVAKDPWRVVRGVTTGGQSEILKQAEDLPRKAEETFGGRTTQAEKDAINRQIAAGDEAYTGTKAELDKLKGADDTFYKESEGAAGKYKDERNNVFNTFSHDQNKAAWGYQDSRNKSMSKQLEGDAAATNKYREARNPVYEKYQGQLKGLSDAAASQASDATQTYKNNIQPRLQDIMSQAQTESGGAMSLKDAGDPNNSVNQAWRGMYEKQAQGVGKQALADVGVMNSLGSQATANQLGGMGGAIGTNQMLALQGQNMGQSGQAYARAQQQMQGLREQGLETGRQESSNQYNRGQAAKDRYTGSVRDYAGADADFQDRMSGYRGEQAGYGERGFGAGKELVQDDYGIDQDRVGLEAGLSRTAASEDYGISKERNKEDFDLGDRRATENHGLSTGLSGLKHGLSGDQAGREISNINQRASTKSGIAANQAGVEQQKRIMGPQILAGVAGAGMKAYGAKGGGTAAAVKDTDEAGDYDLDEETPIESPMQKQATQSGYRPRKGRYS